MSPINRVMQIKKEKEESKLERKKDRKTTEAFRRLIK
jgi:hypothetical protein